jgi:hypothetical protein
MREGKSKFFPRRLLIVTEIVVVGAHCVL